MPESRIVLRPIRYLGKHEGTSLLCLQAKVLLFQAIGTTTVLKLQLVMLQLAIVQDIAERNPSEMMASYYNKCGMPMRVTRFAPIVPLKAKLIGFLSTWVS
jgi:hypothetical protein